MAKSKKATSKVKKAAARKPAKTGAAKKPAPRKVAARKPAKKRVEAVPALYGSVTPHLIVSPCGEAMQFYARAFGAKLLPAMTAPDGTVMHGEMKIGDSIVMLADEMPPMPGADIARKSPRNVGATTGGVMLYVKDVDKIFAQAVAAGGTPVMPPTDMFWGDRYGQVQDPYGHIWALATHTRDVSMAEMKKAMASMPPPGAPGEPSPGAA